MGRGSCRPGTRDHGGAEGLFAICRSGTTWRRRADIQRQRAGGTRRAAGDEHDELAIAGEGVSSTGLGQSRWVGRMVAPEDVGLLEVVGRHGDAPLAARCGGGDELASRRRVRESASATASRVRSSSVGEAAHDGEMSTRRGRSDGGDEVLAAVADDGLEATVTPISLSRSVR